MQVVKFSCDKCKVSWTSQDPQEKRLPLYVVSVHVHGAGQGQEKNLSAEWCRNCTVKAGIVRPATAAEKKAEPAKAPTLEDLIAEIVDNRLAAAGVKP